MAQRQFELVSRRYDETLQLVALLRKQNAPAEVAPVAQVAQLEESVRVLEGKLATATAFRSGYVGTRAWRRRS